MPRGAGSEFTREKARACVAHRMRQHRARDFVEQNVSRRGLDRQRGDRSSRDDRRPEPARAPGRTNAREALSEQIDSAVAEPPELLCGDLECAHDVAARRCSVPRRVTGDVHRQVIHAGHVLGIRECMQAVAVVVDAVAGTQCVGRAVDRQEERAD